MFWEESYGQGNLAEPGWGRAGRARRWYAFSGSDATSTFVTPIPTSPPAPLLLRGESIATLLATSGVASVESVREAGSDCWPVSFETARMWKVRGSGFCPPTGTALGNSEPLNAPPIDRGQNPTLGLYHELSK